jgi:hypothetical protein
LTSAAFTEKKYFSEIFRKFGIRLADGKHETLIACIFIVVGIFGLVMLARIAGQYYDE